MAELMDYVGVMADQIGPRPVSTEEEHQASLYLAQELTDDGFDVDVDEFATPTGVRWPFAIAFLAVILGTVISGVGIFVRGVSLTMFVVGIILIAAGLFVYYSEINNKPVLSKMRVGGVSQNVVARYVPESARREQRRRKVIVVAHVDTVKAELEAMPALIRYTPLLRRIVYYAMIGIAVLTIVRLLPFPWPRTVDTVLWVISLVGCVYLLLAAVCIVARRFTPYVSGGNDNASAGAVLLGVAKCIADPEERARRSQRRRAGRGSSRKGAAGDEEAEFSVSDQEESVVQAAPGAAPGMGELSEEPGTDEATQVFRPVVHDAQTAQAAGVVPDGAELAYDAEAAQGDEAAGVAATAATTVIPQVNAPESSAVTSGAPSASAAADASAPNAFERALGMTQPEAPAVTEEVLGQDPNFPQPSYPEIVEDPAAQRASQQGAQRPAEAETRPQPSYQPLPDGLFAQSPAESVEGESQAKVAASSTAVQTAQAPVEPQAQPAAADAAPAAAAVESERPAAEGRAAKSVPSWYTAAKKKAAQDLEARGQELEDAKEEPQGFRSRYAQIPVNGSMANVRRAMEPEPEPEPVAEAPTTEPAPTPEPVEPTAQAAAGETADTVTTAESQQGASTDAQPSTRQVPSEATAEQGQGAPNPVEENAETIDFGFLDDEIDDIAPDMSGVFTAVDVSQVKVTDVPQVSPSEEDAGKGAVEAAAPEQGDIAPEQPPAESPAQEKTGILKGLTSRIPIIGSSDNSESDLGARRAREAQAGTAAASKPKAERQQAPKQKPERRKPTARHITQEFEPTKPTSERERENESLSSMRQEAAVSSTYEGTPQAGPEYDPFVPTDEQPYDAYGNPTAAFPSLSGQGTASAAPSASDFGESPANSASFPSLSGSFPSLSGSFPSLSGQMPRVNADDFGTVDDADFGYEPTSEDVAEGYGNPNLTGEINIPDSRFHNAMDKVSGLFSHKDKKGKRQKERKHHGRHGKNEEETYDSFDGGNVDNWDEDDDFGWKGGAYVPDDYDYVPEETPRSAVGSAFEAAKARAAEIKDSVIEMSEDDLLDKEVWFVALGASGGGNQGMKNFIELHGPELRGSLIINLEAVGAGDIHYVDFEGTGKSRRSDRRLQSLVRKASKDIDGTEMRPQKLEWRNTDATPAMAAGLRAMTIMGFDGPAPVAWHWSDDTSDIVEPEKLDYVTDLVLDMIENS